MTRETETPKTAPDRMLFRRLHAPTGLGLGRLVHDLVHNRYRFRQFVTIFFIIFVTAVGLPANWPGLFLPGAALIGIGVLVRMWASGHVKKDRQLATNGPYGYVRHPLYVGNHLILFGFCLASGLWWSWIGWAVIVFLFYPSALDHEDSVLHKLFGAQWEAWSAVTQRLIPRLTPYSREPSGWSFNQSLRVNGEPLIAAWLLGSAYLLYLRLA